MALEVSPESYGISDVTHPDALHAMVTASHDAIVDDYLTDLRNAVATVRAHPELAESGQAATYGMIAHIPLHGMVHNQVLNMFASSYRLSGGDIDLPAASSLAGQGAEESAGTPPSVGPVQRLINWYVKRQQSREARR